MKKLCLYIAIVSWGWGVLYLLGSFVAASFDVMAWDAAGRFLVAAMSFAVVSAASFVFAFE